ncbi:TonB-dependent receptor domain-containing protein [Microbulbifer sp. SSSA008]|uniref:TonB-dependent receptor domain-containing protein n=1 Tax=Microbulbifer sp. SSSA008 TaxID=3243380 RepID=UPI00403964FC
MQKKILSVAVLSAISGGVFAQDTASESIEEKVTEEVVVTGSLIPRTNYDGPSPITVIDSAAIQERGFTNLSDVLRSISQSTGGVGGEQYASSFTPNAQQVNLRGMGSGRTLVLLNGRRLPDNPTPNDGQSNFFNFATIPLAAVEHVEVMTDGASAIYGSDAIAGVVNIITKKDLDETVVSLQAGTTTEGGGDSTKLQAVTGFTFDRGAVTLTAEYQEQKPIFGKDRDFMDSYMDRPEEFRYADRAILALDNFETAYIDPTEEVCEASNTGYTYSYRPERGYYCGHDGDGEESLRNYRERWSLFADGRYQVTDSIEFFANTMYWNSSATNQNFRLWWGDDTLDEDFNYTYLQKIFTPAETGSQDSEYDESTWNITAGFNGDLTIAEKDFRWEVAYTFGSYDYEDSQMRFKEEAIDEWFLGTTDLWGYGILSGNSDNSIYNLMSREDAQALMGLKKLEANSESQQFTANIVGDLFEMPTSGMPAAIAVQFEFADQSYEMIQDDRTLNRDGMGWWGLTGTEGGGDRARTALGVEFSLPILSNWEVSLASRYDHYNDDSDVGGRVSSQIKTRYDITDTVALRGGWSQSFRAPDMHYLYAGDSGYYVNVEDYYKCTVDEGIDPADWGSCDVEQVAGSRSGSLELQEETGENLNFGFVFSPVDNLQVAIDWYRIELDNIVLDQDERELMRDEAECRLGLVDSDSDYCQSLYTKIERVTNADLDQDLELERINTTPINQSKLLQEGIDTSFEYTYLTESFGEFELEMTYTILTKYEETVFEGDDPKDLLDALDNYDPRSKFGGALTWRYGDFGTTLFASRIGSLPNYAETGRISSWTTYNLNMSYSVSDNLGLALSVSNLTNKRPPNDPTYETWPYFYRGQYNAIGREVFADVVYRF